MALKILSLNVEGLKHSATVLPFLVSEAPDVICLQESHGGYKDWLQHNGYHVSEMFRHVSKQGETTFDEYLHIASKTPHVATTHLYYQEPNNQQVVSYDIENDRSRGDFGVLFAAIETEQTVYHIGTTHFSWAPDGTVPSRGQLADVTTFIEISQNLPPHVMCGDFNIPRQHNPLYASLTELYADAVPSEYVSSLDATLHRFGSDPTRAKLFSDFMVDYVFTQPPYTAHDVELAFGISDHAAVVATIHV